MCLCPRNRRCYLCLRGRLSRLGFTALLAAGLWGLIGSGPALAQQTQAPLTLPGPGGETNVVADRIQQVGGRLRSLPGHGQCRDHPGKQPARRRPRGAQSRHRRGHRPGQGGLLRRSGPAGGRADRLQPQYGHGRRLQGLHLRAAPYYHLSADRMDKLGEGVYSIRQGLFTTCEGDDPAWSFKIGDRPKPTSSPRSTASDTSFLVKGFPVIPYVPFFAAALRRERQSGFLFPGVRHELALWLPHADAVLLGHQRQPGPDGGDGCLQQARHRRRRRVSLQTLPGRRGHPDRLRCERELSRLRGRRRDSREPRVLQARALLAGDAEPVRQGRLQCHFRRPDLQDLRLYDGGSGASARRYECLRHPALGELQFRRSHLLVPGPDPAPRGRASASARSSS